MTAGNLLTGTSGWSYKHWAEVFYPRGIKTPEWLGYYSQRFNSVEVNNTFYRQPEKHVFESWYEHTPADFVFTLKAGRLFTHLKRLADPEGNLGPFLENASGLKEKLKILLIQLPPGFGFAPQRLEQTLAYLQKQAICPHLTAALEIRDPSWFNRETAEILRKYHASLVMADWPGFTNDGPVTGKLVYLRRHGPGTLYASDYTEGMLQQEGEQIRKWLGQGKQVAVYFNNDAGGFAVKNAARLREIVEANIVHTKAQGEQRTQGGLSQRR